MLKRLTIEPPHREGDPDECDLRHKRMHSYTVATLKNFIYVTLIMVVLSCVGAIVYVARAEINDAVPEKIDKELTIYREEMHEIKADLRKELNSVKTDLKGDISKMDEKIDDIYNLLLELKYAPNP